MTRLVLASQSPIRAQILRQAGVVFDVVSPGVDEAGLKDQHLAAGATPPAVAQALAEAKAVQASTAHAGWVIGADQTLDLNGRLIDKAATLAEARVRLRELRGARHALHAGVAIAEDGVLIWSERQSASLTMRHFSDAYLEAYMARNAQAALSSVGAYHLEAEGVQLFQSIDGDYFTILGLPLLGLLDQLRRLGALQP